MSDRSDSPARPIDRLLAVMARLREPETGCPWDLEQSYETIAPYTIEEAYEVADAVTRGDEEALKDELGDLLFQVVFHAQMAREGGAFDFEAVAEAITEKMIRRHPHVFGDASIADAEAQIQAWESHKAAERRARAQAEGRSPSVMEDVARGLPALMRAEKLQKRAARVGFDWPQPRQVVAKLREELDELEAAMEAGDAAAQEDETGDVLFAAANLARQLKIDGESALREANAKFERRFRRLEALLAEEGKTPDEASLAEMEQLWQRAKAEEFR